MPNVPLLAAALLVAAAADLAAQGSLAARIAAAPEGRVQCTFPARDGVCGDGRSYVSTAPGEDHGPCISTGDASDATRACQPGPVRVVLERAGGAVVSLETVVGPPQPAAGAADLGAVSAADASAYLLDLARRGEGAPARSALLPAVLAEGTDPAPALLAIARDADRPLDTRRSAIGWLSRGVGDLRPDAARVQPVLLALARDGDERNEVRTRAVQALARLEGGTGVEAAMALVRDDDAWLAGQAMSTLASSGDPRVRRFLRDAAARADLGPALQRLAVRGLGRATYATGEDLDALRALHARATDAEVRAEIVRVVGAAGGRENVQWLLGVARDERAATADRRAALRAAGKNATVAELGALYDATGDRTLRQEVIARLAAHDDPAALDRLIAIARSSDDRTLQRQAISRLSRSDDPKVRDALAAIVARP